MRDKMLTLTIGIFEGYNANVAVLKSLLGTSDAHVWQVLTQLEQQEKNISLWTALVRCKAVISGKIEEEAFTVYAFKEQGLM